MNNQNKNQDSDSKDEWSEEVLNWGNDPEKLKLAKDLELDRDQGFWRDIDLDWDTPKKVD